MGRSIRVKFEPDLQPGPAGARTVVEVGVTLVEFGSGTTVAEREAPQPATLVLHGAYLDHARNVSSPDLTRFAKLSGQIVLRGSPPIPLFVCDPKGDFDYEEPEPENGEPFRELRLSYDPVHFDAPPEDGAPSTRLRLPLEPDDARFFELGVELEIAGATEASLDGEARLSIPLSSKPGPIFEWSDELTQALPLGLTLILEESGKRMALDWQQGEIIDGLRRFSFSRLTGKKPCTLSAVAGQKRLTLLDHQIIDDPTRPIKWKNFLEEFLVASGTSDDDDTVRFVGAMPEIAGTV
ncbi:MAG TPA: hypothetical protein VF395_21105 [Polyangiaceae bacterium]